MKLLQHIIFGLIVCLTSTAFAANMPANVDDLMMKLMPMLNEGKVKQALPVFAQIEKLEPSLSVPLPEGFQFLYISTLDKAGDKAKTLVRSKAFMQKYGEASQYASQVTEIINRLEPNPDQTAEVASSGTVIKEAGKIIKDCDNCPEMIAIPDKNYAMGKYEVTQGQWKAIMGRNPSKFKKCGNNCPVEQVSWNDIQKFIQKLNAKTGKQYRLPSYDEWIYACHGDAKDPGYCGDSIWGVLAWNRYDSNHKTHPVGLKEANFYGLYDMNGNVAEMLESNMGSDQDSRVTIGGTFEEESNLVAGIIIDDSFEQIGFRLVRTLP